MTEAEYLKKQNSFGIRSLLTRISAWNFY